MSAAYPVGVTIVRDQTQLHYPLELTLASFAGSCCEAVVVVAHDADRAEVQRLHTKAAPTLPVSFVTAPIAWALRGNAALREVLKYGLMAAVEDASHVLFLEADEYMAPEHVKALCAEAPEVAYLTRLQLWDGLNLLRLDWTCVLPRWASVSALTESLDRGDGDGSCLPLKWPHSIAQFPHWPIYHLSRIGSARMIAKRRRAVAEMYADAKDLDIPDAYDFVPRRYEDWTRGKMPPSVPGLFATHMGYDMPEIAMLRKWVDRDMSIMNMADILGAKP